MNDTPDSFSYENRDETDDLESEYSNNAETITCSEAFENILPEPVVDLQHNETTVEKHGSCFSCWHKLPKQKGYNRYTENDENEIDSDSECTCSSCLYSCFMKI